MKADLVLEGGGVKGIALVGAISALEDAEYEFHEIAGTSAGAIVGALLAADYSGDEIKEVIDDLDYNEFQDKGMLDHIPIIGKMVSLTVEKGIFEGAYLEQWLEKRLLEKGIKTFNDLNGRLRVITTDISNGKMVVFPNDLYKYGYDSRFSVAKAVRMSMSIPFFYEPVKLQNSYFIDGGVLSNFPVHLFDVKRKPLHPTFGLNLIEPSSAGKPNKIHGPISLFAAMFKTMLNARDIADMEASNIVRTIFIPTDVSAIDFDLSKADSNRLYRSGISAATEFLRTWDFDDYIKKIRS